MPPDDPRGVAALHVPGTGGLEIHRLGAGLVNETYRVLRAGSAYALRLAVSNRDDLGLDRAWEKRVLERAISADLAPALEYCDPQRGILITRWIDGRLWTWTDAREPRNISRMASFMRRIHALPMPAPRRSMDPGKWIDHYGAALTRGNGPNRPRDVSAETSAGLPEAPDRCDSRGNVSAETSAQRPGRDVRDLAAAAARRLAALTALPSADRVLCHSDLHSLNLIDRGDSLVLLDWEYAHASDPLWDLAGWSANNDFGEELARDLLTGYAGRPPTGDEYLRLQLLGWLYDYVCLLWSDLYLNPRPGAWSSVAVRGSAVADSVAARAEVLAVRLNASESSRVNASK